MELLALAHVIFPELIKFVCQAALKPGKRERMLVGRKLISDDDIIKQYLNQWDEHISFAHGVGQEYELFVDVETKELRGIIAKKNIICSSANQLSTLKHFTRQAMM